MNIFKYKPNLTETKTLNSKNLEPKPRWNRLIQKVLVPEMSVSCFQLQPKNNRNKKRLRILTWAKYLQD